MTQANEQSSRTISDYVAIYRRRRAWFWWPASAILALALLVAVLTPSSYRSEGRILIEDQEISPNLIGESVSSFATQQIQVISQRVLTTGRIRQIVDDLGVYEIDESAGPVSDAMLAARFKEDMDLGLVRADVIDPRRGVGQAAIGFTLAFTSSEPAVAQKVAEQLVTLFLNENTNRRQERAQDVSRFLSESVARANEELERTEAALAAFRSQNDGLLPEDFRENAGNVRLYEQQLADTDTRIEQLQQRVIELKGQLAALDPYSNPSGRQGELAMTDQERLRVLMAEYQAKSARYRPGHPDLARLEREIAALRETAGEGDRFAQLALQLQQERQLLAESQTRYSDSHPDVVRAKAAIAQLEAEMQELGPSAERYEGADNPAYLVVNTQLQSTELELRNLRDKQRRLRGDIARYQDRIKRAPEVELQYEGLRRQYENAEASFSELQARLREAEVADDVEEELLRSRFTLIEPPTLPLRPIGPNRPAMLFFGLILAFGIGGILVLLSEAFDNRIYGMKAVTELVGAPPLAVVPYLENSADLSKTRRRKVAYAGAIGIVIIATGYFMI